MSKRFNDDDAFDDDDDVNVEAADNIDDDNDNDDDGAGDDVFSFPIDTAEDRKAVAATEKKIAKKKSGGFQSLNLLPSVYKQELFCFSYYCQLKK